MKTINFFIKSIKLRIQEQMMFKANFILMMFTLLSFDLALPLITILIYMHTNGFPGWSFNEILLLQGIFMLINSIDRMFFQRVDWSLSYDVRTGMFDRYLLYPIDTLKYISFTNFGLEHIADFLLGLILIIYSSVKLGIIFTFDKILIFLIFLSTALLFIFSIAILKYSIILNAVRIGRLGEFIRTIKNYAQYPNEIYSNFLGFIFRYLIPLTVLAYIPSKILIENYKDNLVYTFVIVFIFYVFSIYLWKRAIKNYTSAGG
ncbi:MAG: ABC-2 family transporter protein [Candidatus Woesearchaeota archaeon]